MPTLVLFRHLLLPASLEVLFFPLYGALIGAVLGWLFRLRRWIFRLTAGMFIALLLVSHWAAYLELVGEIEAAVRALGGTTSREKLHELHDD